MKTARDVRLEIEKDPALLPLRIRYACWGLGVLAGATFASILAAVALQVTGTQVQVALVLFVIALPLLCQYYIMMTDPRRHYHPSLPSRLAVLAGVLLFVIGFACMLYSVSPLACGAWVVTVVLSVLSSESAERRGYKRLAAGEPKRIPPLSP